MDITDIATYIAIFWIALIISKVLSMIYRLSKNKLAGLTTKPFSRTGSGGKRILLLGDSTAVGTGADTQEDTIAGRLAKDFPKADIINVAKNGSLIRDLQRQIKSVDTEVFDLIIISSGGNDVWHLTSLSKITEDLLSVFPQLKKMSSGKVLFLVYNNIGSAPLFPLILKPFLKSRCYKIQTEVQKLAEFSEIATIELFNEDSDNPFLEDFSELFALDGVHPSSVGYKLWYNRMWRIMVERGYQLN